jgi:hypothetical protein
MQTGLNLTDLATEITRQEHAKRDLLVPTQMMSMHSEKDQPLVMQIGSDGAYGVQETAHSQLSQKLEIPKRYYDRMKQEHPELLADNVNAWLSDAGDQKRLVRTLDGNMRAFLSDRFRPIDNYQILSAALPVLKEIPGLVTKSTQVTERRLYAQFEVPHLRGDVKVGDVVSSGLSIMNSETGYSAYTIADMMWRLACLNGMITAKAMSRHHLGSKLGDGIDEATHYQQDTFSAMNEVLMLQTRDTVKHLLSADHFDLKLETMRSATRREIPGKVTEVITNVTKQFSLTQGEGEDVLSNLIKGGDISQYGLLNAVTAMAHNGDYDRAVEFEQTGGKILALDDDGWEKLVTA